MIPSQGRLNARKKLTCGAMYILKCATADDVLSKIRYPENMNSGQLRKVLALLKPKEIKQCQE